jgi:levansucrase
MENPARWSAEHIHAIGAQAVSVVSRLDQTELVPASETLDVWDAWPVQERNGSPHRLPNDAELWMALGAPKFPDPDERHGHARIHLILRSGESWRHLGQAMPERLSPGSREWSGSAVVNCNGTVVTLYFTAAGRKGESPLSFEQRIFSAQANLTYVDGLPELSGWCGVEEIVVRDPAFYMSTANGPQGVGKIKAFRDPAYFHDPADGAEYLFFAASCANSASEYNGVVGIARRNPANGSWQTLPPLVTAVGLNNELERPHVIMHGGRYYLFWSTQRHVFDPASAIGPTGLYGMVSHSLLVGWQPINGTGLVFANPPEAPAQAYSWFVLPDLSVTSFIDDWAGGNERSFGGTFAPFVNIWISDRTAGIV